MMKHAFALVISFIMLQTTLVLDAQAGSARVHIFHAVRHPAMKIQPPHFVHRPSHALHPSHGHRVFHHRPIQVIHRPVFSYHPRYPAYWHPQQHQIIHFHAPKHITPRIPVPVFAHPVVNTPAPHKTNFHKIEFHTPKFHNPFAS